MRSGSVVFSNARVKALESKLLSSAQFVKLSDSATLSEAFRSLTEFGYGGGISVENYKQFEKMLAAEEQESIDLLRETSVEGSGLAAFLVKLDYFNAKALVKADILKIEDSSFMLFAEGEISMSDLKVEIEGGDYRGLPNEMAGALRAIDAERLAGKLTPRLIDNLIDKAMYAHIFRILEKTKEAVLVDYFTKSADIANIFSFLRIKRAELPAKFFDEVFVLGGTVEHSKFTSAFDQSTDFFREAMAFGAYGEVVAKALESADGLVKAEAMADDMLLRLVTDNKGDMFSIAPIAGFYLTKQAEIKAVKLVIACIKNNVDKNLMKQRMRELYA